MRVKYLTSTLQVINILQIGQPGPDEREANARIMQQKKKKKLEQTKKGPSTTYSYNSGGFVGINKLISKKKKCVLFDFLFVSLQKEMDLNGFLTRRNKR